MVVKVPEELAVARQLFLQPGAIRLRQVPQNFLVGCSIGRNHKSMIPRVLGKRHRELLAPPRETSWSQNWAVAIGRYYDSQTERFLRGGYRADEPPHYPRATHNSGTLADPSPTRMRAVTAIVTKGQPRAERPDKPGGQINVQP
jgi:hypothetical protein